MCVRTALVGCSYWYLLLSPDESHDDTEHKRAHALAPKASSVSGPEAPFPDLLEAPARRANLQAHLRESDRAPRNGGSQVDSEAAKSLKVAPAQSGPKSMRRSSPQDLYARYRR